MNKLSYRHGDLALIGTDKMPDNLKPKKTNVLIGKDESSGGNEHTFSGGVFYPHMDRFIFGYLQAKKTILYHPEHGIKVKGKKLREAKIEDGLYELRRQQEQTHEGMKIVID